jgi:hypothetical protein
MRKFQLILLALAVVLPTACAAQQPSAGAAILFAEGDGGLSVTDQNLIYESLGLALDSTGKGLTACDQPAGAVASFSDWNKDGNKEVLVIFGNSCTSGMAGSSVALFIKDSARAGYSTNLGFPGASADPQPTSNLGYPDLLIGLPGFCFPVWRWDGKEYQYLENVPQGPGGCDNR